MAYGFREGEEERDNLGVEKDIVSVCREETIRSAIVKGEENMN